MSAIENVTLAKIAEGGYEVKDNVFTHHYIHFNKMVAEYNACADEIDKEIIFDRMVTIVIAIMFGGRDPKQVPTATIKRATRNPLEGACLGRADLDARARVKNPNTGIRAMCVKCMGGNPHLIRHCETLACPLWPFRLGTNPFFGRLVNIDAEAEVVEDYEAEEAFEDADKQTDQ